MGNCLVTKLKGAVNNPDLVRINSFRFDVAAEVQSDSAYTNFCYFGKNVNIKFISGNLIAIDGQGRQYSADADNVDLYYFRGTGIVEISNKYTVRQLTVGSMVNPLFDIADWSQYAENVESISIRSTRFGKDAASPSVVNSRIKSLILENSHALGTVTEYVHTYPNLTTFNIFNTSISGEMADFANLASLTRLSLGYRFANKDIVDLVVAYRAAGRTEDSVGIKFENSTFKFNGTTIEYFNIQKTLTWTSSTITFDGTTIDA